MMPATGAIFLAYTPRRAVATFVTLSPVVLPHAPPLPLAPRLYKGPFPLRTAFRVGGRRVGGKLPPFAPRQNGLAEWIQREN